MYLGESNSFTKVKLRRYMFWNVLKVNSKSVFAIDETTHSLIGLQKMKKLWQNLNWTDQLLQYEVLLNNIPLKYDPLLYVTTRHSLNCFALGNNNKPDRYWVTSLVTDFVSF